MADEDEVAQRGAPHAEPTAGARTPPSASGGPQPPIPPLPEGERGRGGEVVGATLTPTPEEDTPPAIEVRAELDLPGETGRQARIFAAWALCLALAIAVGSAVGAHVAADDEGSLRAERELSRSRSAKAQVALVLGLVLPGLITLVIDARYRRGGAHARGIVVDVASGELRVWGRGYGTRVRLREAEVKERLVDVYAGRLGAWRQRRFRVRSVGREIEIATTARASDTGDGLTVEGGEGDCIEIGRDDFDKLRALVTAAVRGAA
jgi:hypothetical protein